MEKNKNSGLVTAGLIIGIIALILSAVPIINNFAFFLGIISFILVIIAFAKKNRGGKVIATFIISILSIIVVLASQSFYGKAIDSAVDKTNKEIDKASGNKTEDVLKDDVNVSLGNLNITSDEYGYTDSYMDVVVKNKLNKKKSYSIHIEAVDENGSRIMDDYVYANDLGPNQSQTFKIFEYIEDSKLDSMRSAKFNIVEASSF